MSNNHAYEWLSTLFEPENGKRKLLLLDRYGSYLIARFIAFYIDNKIDLVVILP